MHGLDQCIHEQTSALQNLFFLSRKMQKLFVSIDKLTQSLHAQQDSRLMNLSNRHAVKKK